MNGFVPRISWPRKRRVFDEIVRARKPVVFLGAFANARAVERWRPSFFAEHHGDLEIGTLRNEGRTNDTIEFGRMKLGELVRRMRTEPLYILGLPVLERLPELRADLPMPDHLVGRRTSPPCLNLGSANYRSALHFDIAHNLYVQLHGRRRAFLAAPSERAGLYHPSIVSAKDWTASPVDVAAPDYRRYPRFAGVTTASTILEPGEALFIPGGHRHGFESDGDTVSLSLFWETSTQWLTRRLLSAVGRFTL